jgi:hypothetical protein
MAKTRSTLNRLLLGRDEPNQAQLKLYSSSAASISRTLLLVSGAAVLFPIENNVNVFLGVLGLLTSMVLLVTASRFLREVKDK